MYDPFCVFRYSRISGVQDTIVEEGLHFRVPWFQRPVIYDIRAKAHRFTSPTGTKDLQMVNISLRVLYVLLDLASSSFFPMLCLRRMRQQQ